MTILALRTSRHANGVSALHGEVSRGLWEDVWAGVPREEVPITSITNGIHTKTWMAPEFSAMYDKYLGNWEENLVDAGVLARRHRYPGRGALGDPPGAQAPAHRFRPRPRANAQRERLGESMESIRKANLLLDPEILTIGFARRFATYKRGTLLFSDLDRLRRILANKDQPVQFIFSGKAHPKDDGGKKIHPGGLPLLPRGRVREPHRLRRGLRHLRGPAADAGRRSLAQQSAAPARGQRHQRHEAAAQRRPEPERARWLVVRRLQRQERLGHRRRDQGPARPEPQAGVPERGRFRQPLPHPRDPGHPALLREARRAAAHRLAATDARVDPQRHARLQHPSHGQGIQRAPLRARGRASTANCSRTIARRPARSANGRRASATIGRRSASRTFI